MSMFKILILNLVFCLLNLPASFPMWFSYRTSSYFKTISLEFEINYQDLEIDINGKIETILA